MSRCFPAPHVFILQSPLASLIMNKKDFDIFWDYKNECGSGGRGWGRGGGVASTKSVSRFYIERKKILLKIRVFWLELEHVVFLPQNCVINGPGRVARKPAGLFLQWSKYRRGWPITSITMRGEVLEESGRDDETEMAINYCIWQPFPDDAE